MAQTFDGISLATGKSFRLLLLHSLTAHGSKTSGFGSPDVARCDLV